MSVLYDSEFIDLLPDVERTFHGPLVAHVAKQVTDYHRNLFCRLEEVYQRIPSESRNLLRSRLRSQSDKEFIPAMYELLVYDFCSSHGQATYSPKIEDNKTPDVVLRLGNTRYIVDVVALFDEKSIEDEHQGVYDLLNYLNKCDHWYNVGVDYKRIDRSRLKKSVVRKQLIRHLDYLDQAGVEETEWVYQSDGIDATFVISRSVTRGPICHAFMSPAKGQSPPASVANRIREKVKRYKKYGPVIVAACKAGDTGLEWKHVAQELYGRMHVSYRTQPFRRSGTRLMGKRLYTPDSNTALSGVLHCDVDQTGQLDVKLLGNPYATEIPAFNGPTYTLDPISESCHWTDPVDQDRYGLH